VLSVRIPYVANSLLMIIRSSGRNQQEFYTRGTPRMSSDIRSGYVTRYAANHSQHIYPVEFVVRAFLGSYPRLKRETSGGDYRGQRVLDLGFGDGRNVPLLSNLGMEVHGVEIAKEICQSVTARLRAAGYDLIAKTGRNDKIPYVDGFFDCVLACHACYYVTEDTTFADNVSEIARVLKGNGRFVFSAPIGTSYIMRGAEDLGDGHMRIVSDPYGIRNGAVLKKFDSADQIVDALSGQFQDFSIGSCRNDYWGIEEHVWCVVCRRQA